MKFQLFGSLLALVSCAAAVPNADWGCSSTVTVTRGGGHATVTDTSVSLIPRRTLGDNLTNILLDCQRLHDNHESRYCAYTSVPELRTYLGKLTERQIVTQTVSTTTTTPTTLVCLTRATTFTPSPLPITSSPVIGLNLRAADDPDCTTSSTTTSTPECDTKTTGNPWYKTTSPSSPWHKPTSTSHISCPVTTTVRSHPKSYV